MTTNEAPKLPIKLWIRVLDNLAGDEDLPDLWMSCRHVCTAFKDATESIFRERQLPQTKIEFQLGSHDTQTEGEMLLNFEFEFDRFSEDNNTAIFKAEEYPEELAPIVWKRLPEYLEHMKIEAPLHTIQIRRDINDGPLSGITMDYEKSELSCDWREMLSAFYGEEHLYQNHTKNWVASKEAWTRELKGKMDRGEMDAMQVIEKAIFAFADGSDDSRKIARRTRIHQQYKRLYGLEWDMEQDGDKQEESKILTKLLQMRQFAISEGFSDEETDEDEGWDDEDDADSEADNDSDDEETGKTA